MRLQPGAHRVDRSMRLGRLAMARHDIRGRAEGHGHRGRGLRHAAGEVLRPLLPDVRQALILLALARVLLSVAYDDDVCLLMNSRLERDGRREIVISCGSLEAGRPRCEARGVGADRL